MKKIIILGLLIGLSANTAYAELGVKIDSNTDIGVSVQPIKVDAEADIEVTSNSKDEGVKSEESNEVNDTSKIESTTKVSTETETFANIDITVKTNGTTDNSISNSSQVSNETELKSYATVVVNKNESVEKVEAKQKELAVTYKSKAKLFGFIPLTVKNKAEVTLTENENSTVASKVKVKMPWYKFLLKVDSKASDSESKIKKEIDKVLISHINIDAQAHAKTLEAIETTLSSNTSASIN